MKTILITGADIKEDNGSGYSLSQAFSGRRFHNNVVYKVWYQGISLDNSTARGVKRARKGWETI